MDGCPSLSDVVRRRLQKRNERSAVTCWQGQPATELPLGVRPRPQQQAVCKAGVMPYPSLPGGGQAPTAEPRAKLAIPVFQIRIPGSLGFSLTTLTGVWEYGLPFTEANSLTQCCTAKWEWVDGGFAPRPTQLRGTHTFPSQHCPGKPGLPRKASAAQESQGWWWRAVTAYGTHLTKCWESSYGQFKNSSEGERPSQLSCLLAV